VVMHHLAFNIYRPLLVWQWPILFGTGICRARRAGAIALLSSAYDIGRVVILSVKLRWRGA